MRPGQPEDRWYERACERACPGMWSLDAAMGAGSFASIVRATHCASGERVALKLTDKMRPELADPRILHRVRAEARILQRLVHANIVRCFGAIESDMLVVVVLSCEPGSSLAELVSGQGALQEAHAAPVVLQLARALKHCHQRKICHRDVKLDNVVYDAGTGRAVLVDWGLALAVRSQGSRLDLVCGSHEYCAPELLDAASKGYYGPAVDMWALGVTAYALLCAAFPFGRAQTKICRGVYAGAPLDAARPTAAARDFVASALTVDPNSVQRVNRLSSADACRHPWLLPHAAAADAAAATASAPVALEALVEAVQAARATAAETMLGAVEDAAPDALRTKSESATLGTQ